MTKIQKYIHEVLDENINLKTSDVIKYIKSNYNKDVSPRHVQRIRKRIKKQNERKEQMTTLKNDDVFDSNNNNDNDIPTDDEMNIINYIIANDINPDSNGHIHMISNIFKISIEETKQIINKFRWLIDKEEDECGVVNKVKVTDVSLADINPNWIKEDDYFEVKIDCITACSKIKKNVKVYMSRKAREKASLFMNWAKAREWLAYLVGEKIDDYHYNVMDLYLPDQRTSASLVDDIVADEFNKYSIIGVIHSHHEMGAGDENHPSFSTHDDNFINGNHNISLLAGKDRVTKGFKIFGIARVTTQCGGLMKIKAEVLSFKEMSLSEEKDLKKEFFEKTQRKTYNTVNTVDIFGRNFTKVSNPRNGVKRFHFNENGWPGNQFNNKYK